MDVCSLTAALTNQSADFTVSMTTAPMTDYLNYFAQTLMLLETSILYLRGVTGRHVSYILTRVCASMYSTWTHFVSQYLKYIYHTRLTMYICRPFQYDCKSRWPYELVLVALRSVVVSLRCVLVRMERL